MISNNFVFITLITLLICGHVFIYKDIFNTVLIINNNIKAFSECYGIFWLSVLDVIFSVSILFQIFKYFFHQKIILIIIEIMFHSAISLMLLCLTYAITEYIDNDGDDICMYRYFDYYPDLYDEFEDNYNKLLMFVTFWLIILIASIESYIYNTEHKRD